MAKTILVENTLDVFCNAFVYVCGLCQVGSSLEC